MSDRWGRGTGTRGASFVVAFLAVVLSCTGAQDPFNDQDVSTNRPPVATRNARPLVGRLDKLDPVDADWSTVDRRLKDGFGPRRNPDDQYRFFWFLTEMPWRLDTKVDSTDRFTPWGMEGGWRLHYPAARDAGFNLFIAGFWEYSYDDIRVLDRVAAERHALWEQVDRDGLEGCERLGMPRYTDFKARFGCREIGTGKPQERPGLDLSRADTRAAVVSAARRQAAYFKDCPAVTWVMTSSEVRDHSIPTDTPEYAAACRAALGFDPPPDVKQSRVIGARGIPDFPKSNIVETDHPYYRYLRWFWKEGDGWNRYQGVMADVFEKTLGRKVTAYFEPGVRCPPIRGSGGDVDAISHWVYSNPLPFSIDWVAAEMQAMARGRKGQKVLVSLQGITWRNRVAPFDEKVENPPAWTRERPNVLYMTTPPDTLKEQLWTAAGRHLDGIGVYPWNTLFDCTACGWNPNRRDYQCTTNGAIRAIAETFAKVFIPLGPLLRAVPERAPDFAVLESGASAILRSNGMFGWGGLPGPLFTAANLSPQVLYEEDLEAGVPADVKVLALVCCHTLTRPAFEAVEAFRRRGGIVVGQPDTAAPVRLDAQVPFPLPETVAKPLDDKEAWRHTRVVRKSAAMMKETLAKLGYRSPVDSTVPDIVTHLRSTASADYIFAVNDKRTFGDYVGQWRHFEEQGLPNAGTLILRKLVGAVYDLVTHESVPFTTKDGVTEIPVGIAAAEGRILMAVPEPLKPLAASVAGDKVTVTSGDRGAMIPIAVERKDEAPYYGVVKDGEFVRTIPGATAVVNLATGASCPLPD